MSVSKHISVAIEVVAFFIISMCLIWTYEQENQVPRTIYFGIGVCLFTVMAIYLLHISFRNWKNILWLFACCAILTCWILWKKVFPEY